MLQKCHPSIIRYGEGAATANRRGISEAELLRALSESGAFERFRDRKAVKMAADPTGAGMCVFKNLRWRDPSSPVDLKFLREQQKRLAKKYPSFAAETSLEAMASILKATIVSWNSARNPELACSQGGTRVALPQRDSVRTAPPPLAAPLCAKRRRKGKIWQPAKASKSEAAFAASRRSLSTLAVDSAQEKSRERGARPAAEEAGQGSRRRACRAADRESENACSASAYQDASTDATGVRDALNRHDRPRKGGGVCAASRSTVAAKPEVGLLPEPADPADESGGASLALCADNRSRMLEPQSFVHGLRAAFETEDDGDEKRGNLCLHRTESRAASEAEAASHREDAHLLNGDSDLWEMLPLEVCEMESQAGCIPPVTILPPDSTASNQRDFTGGGAQARRNQASTLRRRDRHWAAGQDALLAGIDSSDLSIAQSLAVVAGQAQSMSKAGIRAEGSDRAIVQSLAVVARR